MTTPRPLPYRLVIAWSDEDEAYLVRVPALNGLISQPFAHGESIAEAARQGEIALAGLLQILQERGTRLPPAEVGKRYSGKFNVRLPSRLHEEAEQQAALDGTSLNQFMVAAVSSHVGRAHDPARVQRAAPQPKPARRKFPHEKDTPAPMSDRPRQAATAKRAPAATSKRTPAATPASRPQARGQAPKVRA